MSIDNSDPGHGNSPAAWTAVVIMLVAFTVGTIAFWFEIVPIVIASGVLVALGPVVGFILARAGYGVGGVHVVAKEH